MSNPEDQKQPQGALEVDYRETTDITHVHAAIQREKKEPLTDSIPIPLWLMSLFGLILCWGSFYFGMFSGGFSGDVFNERAGLPGSKKAGAGQGAESAPLTLVQQGEKVFKSNCATCHQTTGLGTPGQYPPLAGSEFVNGTPKRLAMILLKGLQGPVKVKGNTFNGQMPTWTTLQDKQIAAVLTYIRQEWGNKGGEVAPAQISKMRDTLKDRSDPWAEADLLAVPPDAVLEGAPAATDKPAPAPEVKK